ncbi:MAG: hypothetical protein QME75_01505 [Deltaproteobacteria bacterium]|nr:hypothetical protein [Deltaproteobacteria bacterium]
MDDLEKALDSLRFQIKKEIVDNYFAERVYLEEDIQLLEEEVQDYQKEHAKVRRLVWAIYQALGSEAAAAAVMRLLALKAPPFYQEFQNLPEVERRGLLAGRRIRGFTAWRRHRNLVLDLYEDLVRQTAVLKEKYAKITSHLRLVNEDIQKFNSSFDFGLIAAQIEAMEGGGEVLCGGLECQEREELSTRMRFKRRQLTEEELPPPLELPPLNQIKSRMIQALSEFYA